MYTKINKAKARKLVAQGKQIFCAPNNEWLGSAWISPCEVPLDGISTSSAMNTLFTIVGQSLGKELRFT